MNIVDINGWLKPSEGYQIDSVRAEGAYLRVEYKHMHPVDSDPDSFIWDREVIYLNDTGREVARTQTEVRLPKEIRFPISQPTPESPAVLSVGAWFRFKNGFLILLEGLKEMIQCRSK
jgi:hypothetical protein